MADDKIAVRLDEIVKALNKVLEAAAGVPSSIWDVEVPGPGNGVTREFRLSLGLVALKAIAAAEANKKELESLAQAITASVNELEEMNLISQQQLERYEAALDVPVNRPHVGNAAATGTGLVSRPPSGATEGGSAFA